MLISFVWCIEIAPDDKKMQSKPNLNLLRLSRVANREPKKIETKKKELKEQMAKIDLWPVYVMRFCELSFSVCWMSRWFRIVNIAKRFQSLFNFQSHFR